MYTRINKNQIQNLISNGWNKEFIYCASQQDPYTDSELEKNYISTSFFNDTAHFNRWYEKQKSKICNNLTGRTLKFYLKGMIDIMKTNYNESRLGVITEDFLKEVLESNENQYITIKGYMNDSHPMSFQDILNFMYKSKYKFVQILSDDSNRLVLCELLFEKI